MLLREVDAALALTEPAGRAARSEQGEEGPAEPVVTPEEREEAVEQESDGERSQAPLQATGGGLLQHHLA